MKYSVLYTFEGEKFCHESSTIDFKIITWHLPPPISPKINYLPHFSQ